MDFQKIVYRNNEIFKHHITACMRFKPPRARPRAFSVSEKTLARSAKTALCVASRHARSCRFGQK